MQQMSHFARDMTIASTPDGRFLPDDNLAGNQETANYFINSFALNIAIASLFWSNTLIVFSGLTSLTNHS